MEIGPVIGKAVQRDALVAITVSMIAIILYIAFRFEFKFGVAAAIATIHDVFAVLGIFYILNWEINLLIVTALLTLAGYSLTDTVVVFDRIRENLKRNKRDALPQLVNNSINEVLSRTIITSLTVVHRAYSARALRRRGAVLGMPGAQRTCRARSRKPSSPRCAICCARPRSSRGHGRRRRTSSSAGARGRQDRHRLRAAVGRAVPGRAGADRPAAGRAGRSRRPTACRFGCAPRGCRRWSRSSVAGGESGMRDEAARSRDRTGSSTARRSPSASR